MTKVWIVSQHSNRLIGFGDDGPPDDWLWTRVQDRAHAFTEAEAQAFIQVHLQGADVWLQKVS